MCRWVGGWGRWQVGGQVGGWVGACMCVCMCIESDRGGSSRVLFVCVLGWWRGRGEAMQCGDWEDGEGFGWLGVERRGIGGRGDAACRVGEIESSLRFETRTRGVVSSATTPRDEVWLAMASSAASRNGYGECVAGSLHMCGSMRASLQLREVGSACRSVQPPIAGRGRGKADGMSDGASAWE